MSMLSWLRRKDFKPSTDREVDEVYHGVVIRIVKALEPLRAKSVFGLEAEIRERLLDITSNFDYTDKDFVERVRILVGEVQWIMNVISNTYNCSTESIQSVSDLIVILENRIKYGFYK